MSMTLITSSHQPNINTIPPNLPWGVQDIKNLLSRNANEVDSLLKALAPLSGNKKLIMLNHLIRCFNEISVVHRMQAIIAFLKKAPLGLKYELGTKVDVLQVTPEELTEIISTIKFEAPLSLIEYFNLTPQQKLNAAAWALMVNPDIFPHYVKQNNFTIEGENAQFELAKLFIHYDKNSEALGLRIRIARINCLSRRTFRSIYIETLRTNFIAKHFPCL